MQAELVIELQTDPASSDMDAIVAGLTDCNASQADGEVPEYLILVVRDDAQDVVGGLVGSTYLGWLQIHVVWMLDALRRRGYGTALMRRAEHEALLRGCPRAFLETFSFQALPFYEKLGYRVVSRIADFPPGGARYALTREFDAQG